MLFPRAFTPVLAFVLFLGASWASAQDRAYNAIPLTGTSVTTFGNNLGATTVGSDPIANLCVVNANVWYSYVAPCNGGVLVDTCGSGTNFNTVLHVFDGSCGPNSLIFITCNGNGYCPNNRAAVGFTATQGTTYYISVGGAAGAFFGSFELHVNCVPGIQVNDDLGALPIGLGVVFYIPKIVMGDRIVGNNVGATTSAGLSCNAANDVWYYFFPSVSGNVTISTCNADVGGMSNFDTVLNVFAGIPTPSYIGCNDDACGGLQSKFTFAATAGQAYWVSVGGYGGATGRFGLKVWQEDALAFRFFDQGPGTIGFRIAGAPGYYYYLFATTHAGAYANGWFYGIDISMAEISYEIGVGPPLTGPLTTCGTVGPFGPLPPGLTIYGVALGTPTAGGYPTVVSAPYGMAIL